jgi:hypothetical protein
VTRAEILHLVHYVDNFRTADLLAVFYLCCVFVQGKPRSRIACCFDQIRVLIYKCPQLEVNPSATND